MRLAISGKMLTGKSSIAKALEPWGFKRMAFADPLKDFACHEFGITRAELERDKDHYREYLQRTGQAMKTLHKDDLYWAKKLFEEIKALPPIQNIVVDDVRFPYELDELIDMGFTHIKLIAPLATREYRGKIKFGPDFVIPMPEHESETALDNFTPQGTLIVTNGMMMDDPAPYARYLLRQLLSMELDKETWWRSL